MLLLLPIYGTDSMDHIDTVWFAVVNPHAGSGKMLSLWKNAEDLENTAFLDTINTLSSSFDESLVKAIAESRGGYREYRLGDIITPAGSWERAEDFIRIWMDAALEIDYEG